MHPIRPIDPVITFKNSQGEAVRGTLTNVQRRSLVMEIYNPFSIVQVSEVLAELTIRSGERNIYKGKAVVTSLLNTGLMAVVSVVLIDEWSDLNMVRGDLSRVADEAQRFVEDWESRFRISRSYQVAISEFRAFPGFIARPLARLLPSMAWGIFWGLLFNTLLVLPVAAAVAPSGDTSAARVTTLAGTSTVIASNLPRSAWLGDGT